MNIALGSFISKFKKCAYYTMNFDLILVIFTL